jgi:hypothetical protein
MVRGLKESLRAKGTVVKGPWSGSCFGLTEEARRSRCYSVRTAVRIVLPALVGLVILLASTSSAEARTRFINTEDQILDLGPVPDDIYDLVQAEDGYDRVGFFYSRVAILGADVWSWSGTLVFYRKKPDIKFEGLRSVETTYYVEIPDELVEQYGWSTPIEYRIPVGLLVAACLVELAIVARKKRRAKLVLSLGIGMVALAGILFLLGMTWQIAFPLIIGVVHIVFSLPYFQPASNAEASAAMTDDEHDPPFAPKPAPERPSGPMLPPPPNVETDPFRAPPQPPPIVVKRAPAAPNAAPVVRDDKADAPKLLR